MYRFRHHIRVLVAALLVALAASVIGLGAAAAGPQDSCDTVAATHHAGSAWALGACCDADGCGIEPVGCCAGLAWGGCSASAVTLPETGAFAGIAATASDWAASLAERLAGMAPQVGRRPPRFIA